MHALLASVCLWTAAVAGEPTTASAPLRPDGTPRRDADDLAMPWSNDLHPALPLRAGGAFAAHLVPGRVPQQFFSLSAGGPLWAAANGGWSLDIAVYARFAAMEVPSEHRGVVDPPGLEGELWFTFPGPKRRSFHAMGIGGGAPVREPGLFWLDERDAEGSGSLFYAGYVYGAVVDTDLYASFGPTEWSFAHAEFGGGPVFKANAWIAVPLGLWASTSGGYPAPDDLRVVATTGVHLRPRRGLELGLDLTAPLRPTSTLDHEPPVWPSLTLRAWDARSGASAAPLWSGRLAR